MTELPLNTLNSSDLLMQWRVMRALGYKSLFDPEFHRELQNPMRKALYYQLVLMEEATNAYLLSQTLKSLIDKLTFFINPELFRKFNEQEERAKLQDATERDKKIKELEDKYAQAKAEYVPPSAEEQVKIKEILNAR